MRVVAGELRGRRLVSPPPGDATRPTTDKAREAIFNALGSLDVVQGAQAVDLFAGTGALGIEALSRGAAHVTFVENRRPALRVLHGNIEALGIGDRVTVVETDASSPDQRRLCHRRRPGTVVSGDTSEPVGGELLVFADPPYDFDGWGELFDSLSRWAPAPFVVTESGRELDPPDPWMPRRSRRYGRTWIAFYEVSAP